MYIYVGFLFQEWWPWRFDTTSVVMEILEAQLSWWLKLLYVHCWISKV